MITGWSIAMGCTAAWGAYSVFLSLSKEPPSQRFARFREDKRCRFDRAIDDLRCIFRNTKRARRGLRYAINGIKIASPKHQGYDYDVPGFIYYEHDRQGRRIRPIGVVGETGKTYWYKDENNG